MAAPLNEGDVRWYEGLFRFRRMLTLLAAAVTASWVLLMLGGSFVGVLGYDGFVSIIYRVDSGVALYGGKWYYVGVAPVVLVALSPIALYATSWIDTENVLVRGPGIAWSLGVLYGFLLIALAAMALGAAGELVPLMTDSDHVILHRGRRLSPPYYERIVAVLVAGVTVAAVYHRLTLTYTYRSIGRRIYWAGMTAAFVFLGSFPVAEFVGADALTMPTVLVVSGTVVCQSTVMHALHLRRWPRVLEAYGRGYCLGCGYDLRGTIAAGRDGCPECGKAVAATRIQTTAAQRNMSAAAAKPGRA